jgi:hypothetical protein
MGHARPTRIWAARAPPGARLQGSVYNDSRPPGVFQLNTLRFALNLCLRATSRHVYAVHKFAFS